MPPFFQHHRTPNCHITLNDRLSGAEGALVCSTLQFVHHCNLGNTGEFLRFSELLLMFDVFSCQQRCWGLMLMLPFDENTLIPAEEPPKGGAVLLSHVPKFV